MKRWKSADFIIALILSMAYFYVALLNCISPFHSPLLAVSGPTVHPILVFVYLVIALAITWGIYTISKNRKSSYFFAIIVGIAIIISGLFLWKIAEKFEDTVSTMAK